MPSHRADRLADAPTGLLTADPARPSRRRRDLRPAPADFFPAPRTQADAVAAVPSDLSVQPTRAFPLPARRATVEPFPVPGSAARRDRAGAAAGAGPLSWLDELPVRPPAPRPAPATSGSLALAPLFTPAVPAEATAEPHFGLPVEQPARQSEAASPAPLPTRRSLRAAQGKPAGRTQPVPEAAPGGAGAGVARDPWADPQPTSRRGASFGLPHVGIVGALGIATIAVPLSGAFAVAPATKPVANAVAAAGALQPLPPFPLVANLPATALDDVRLLPDETQGAAVPARLAAPRTLLVDRASRSDQRPVLPGCDGHVPDTAGVLNGRLPASMLCTLWDPARQLRSDAAVAIAKLNLAYRVRFGHPMCFRDAYRSLAEQYRVKAERGSFAARPGTSEHGWGVAVDLCDGVENGSGSATYTWMRENAPTYGWDNPTWARAGGAGPHEPWHWEYLPAEKKQGSGD